MADEVRKTTQTTTDLGDTVQSTKEVRASSSPDPDEQPAGTLAINVVRFIEGVLLSLMAIRFVLSLLGANRANGFADFIYSVTHPLVSPFFSLFSYDAQYGVSKVEVATLVAMAVYALVAYGIIKLIELPRKSA